MTVPLVNVRMRPEVIERLDAVAERRGVTRSDLLREAIADIIAADEAEPVGASTK